MWGDLQAQVAAVFAADGPLAQQDPHYQVREGQQAMAAAVAQTLIEPQALVVEAGTGVGKTFAYLVPLLLSGQRALVSTASKTLQDQLYARDLPRLLDTLKLPLNLALLKGRASYLCLYRLEQARSGGGALGPEALAQLARVERWATATRTGDLAELPELDERSALISAVTSTRENCLGSKCPRFRECHVNQARKAALAADLVVINHHLFFADAAVRESGMAELLPTVQAVVFDEAHQLNEIGVQFLGEQLGSAQLLELCSDALAAGLQHARGWLDWTEAVGPLDLAARDLRLIVGVQRGIHTRLSWQDKAPQGIDEADWSATLAQVGHALADLRAALLKVREAAVDFERLIERVQAAQHSVQVFERPCPQQEVRWLETGHGLRLVQAPLDIAQTVREKWLGLAPAAAPIPASASASTPGEDGLESCAAPDAEVALPSAPGPGRARSWVFTSATLGDDAKLSWFTEPCGLETAQVLRVGSPFDYAKQAAIHVPRQLPSAKEAGHSRALAAWLAPRVRLLGGRTLVLTTTTQAMRVIAEALRSELGERDAPEVLMQGQWSKRRLMTRFRAGASTAQEPAEPCVLVATASFWEGFDVPGDALQWVVIDKLPFPPPSDPMVQARSRRIEAEGGRAFERYALAEAAVALKQGAGRLIRNETDRGLLTVADSRLLQMGYGARLRKSLPPMRWVLQSEAFDAELQALAERQTLSACAKPVASDSPQTPPGPVGAGDFAVQVG